MFRKHHHSILTMSVAALTLAVAGCAANAGSASTGGSPALACEIKASPSGGATAIEGFVTSATAAGGTYTLEVRGSGGGNSTNIRQGGEFSAAAGRSESLGQVTLGGSGRFEATLTVNASGKSATCTEEFGRI